jgi:hypothetical protein
MPKRIEEPRIEGDKFVAVGFISNTDIPSGDFYESGKMPVIQSFMSDDLWVVPSQSWVADDARKLDRSTYNVTAFNTSEFILIEEGQTVQAAGEFWLDLLRNSTPELMEQFADWKVNVGENAFRYHIASYDEQTAFSTELATYLEKILVAALRAHDEKTSALTYHLYETAVPTSGVSLEHSYLVRGAFTEAMDSSGTAALESFAKRDKIYRNHKKFTTALSAFRSANGLA